MSAQGWDLDNLSQDEQQRFTALYGSHPAAADPSSPGAFAGWYKAAAGIPSGVANVGLDVAKLAVNPPDVLGHQYRAENGVAEPSDAPIHTGAGLFDAAANSVQDVHGGWDKFQPQADHAIDQARQDVNRVFRPDPQTTGFVGNTLFGATDVVTRVVGGDLVAPGFGLTLAAGTTGYERAKDLEAQGVDPSTATESGLLAGGSLLGMGGVAGMGKTALMRALTSAGVNFGFGAGQRGLDSALLADHGYTAQAAQEKWNDGASMLGDIIIGGAFGLLPHGGASKDDAGGAPPIPSDLIDSALVAKNAQHVNEVAPGVPADPRSAGQHVDALDTATGQLLNGHSIDVDPIVRGATFVPRPVNADAAAGIDEAFRSETAGTGDGALAQAPELIDQMPYQARLDELRQRRQQGESLSPEDQNELIDLQDQDARQAKVAGKPMAGVQNMVGRAQAEQAGKLLPVQVFADADNFKDLNDSLGHGAGDTVIRQIGTLMAKALGEGNVFHRGGDEFIGQGHNESDVTAAMERMREYLATMAIKATNQDGGVITQNGIGLSYGKGSDVESAETAQYADKDRRKRAGLRTDRRESTRPAATDRRNGPELDPAGSQAGEDRVGTQTNVSDRVYHGTLDSPSAHDGTPGLLRLPEVEGGEGRRPDDLRGTQSASQRVPGQPPDLNPAAGGVSVSGDSIRSTDAAYGTPDRHPWVELDDTRNIPYAGGVSGDGNTVYLSKYMPDTVKVSGKTIDAKEGVFVHEVEEQKVMVPDGPKSPEYMTALRADITSESKANPNSPKIPKSDLVKVKKGKPLAYPQAHAIATVRENAFIRAKYGIDPEQYQKALADGIDAARTKARAEGDIPADIDTTPYDDLGQRKLLQGHGETPTAGGDTVGVPSEGSAGATDASPADRSTGTHAGVDEAQQGDPARDGATDARDAHDPLRADDVARARQVLADRASETLDEGGTIADAMRAADEDVQAANRQSDGIKAAVACFLRFGSDL